MNFDLIITGLIALLIGLLAQVFDKPRSMREKRDVPLGYTESNFKAAKWALIIGGVFFVIYGLLNET